MILTNACQTTCSVLCAIQKVHLFGWINLINSKEEFLTECVSLLSSGKLVHVCILVLATVIVIICTALSIIMLKSNIYDAIKTVRHRLIQFQCEISSTCHTVSKKGFTACWATQGFTLFWFSHVTCYHTWSRFSSCVIAFFHLLVGRCWMLIALNCLALTQRELPRRNKSLCKDPRLPAHSLTWPSAVWHKHCGCLIFSTCLKVISISSVLQQHPGFQRVNRAPNNVSMATWQLPLLAIFCGF